VAPIWLSRFDRWTARRARERQQTQRILARMANGDDTPSMPPEPRERLHINDIWTRVGRPHGQAWRQYQPDLSWHRYTDQLRAERRRMTTTNYRDGFR
jgi:hypothetical protein